MRALCGVHSRGPQFRNLRCRKVASPNLFQGLGFFCAPFGGALRPASGAACDMPRISGAFAVDIELELLNGELLLGDDVLHQVTDRHHADQAIVFDDRQVAHAPFGH